MSTHDKDSAPSANELQDATDAALEALAWTTPTGCDIRATRTDNVEADEHKVTNGGLQYDVVCYRCSTDCECSANGWCCEAPEGDEDPETGERVFLPEMMDGLRYDWDDAAKAAMLETVTQFITHVDEDGATNSDDLHGIEYAQIGHDITLTRNGHGAGFWDRGYGPRGERLSTSARALGEAYAYADHETKTLKLEA